MNFRDIINSKTHNLQANNRLRTIKTHSDMLDFASNDYFSMRNDNRVIEAAKQALTQYGLGAGASRHISGNHHIYNVLESNLAQYKGYDAACIFGSGYLANIGLLQAICEPKDVIIADRLVHNSIINGAKLSGAKLVRFQHNNMESLERLLAKHSGNKFVISESIFSMDGDIAPLADIRQLCDKHNAIMIIDDAHGLGIIHNNQADIVIGTLSKGLGSYGGYICASDDIIRHIKGVSQALIYSTALPANLLAGANKALEIIAENNLGEALMNKVKRHFTDAQSPIIPHIIGSDADMLKIAENLYNDDILVGSIRPPTVPEGTSRLRITINLSHTDKDIKRVMGVI